MKNRGISRKLAVGNAFMHSGDFGTKSHWRKPIIFRRLIRKCNAFSVERMNPFRAGFGVCGTDESVPYGGCVLERMDSFRAGFGAFGTDESVPYVFCVILSLLLGIGCVMIDLYFDEFLA